jgi:hypothetical protein
MRRPGCVHHTPALLPVIPWGGKAAPPALWKSRQACRKRHFCEFSLCLSRACLGKKMTFIYKWRKKPVFLPHNSKPQHSRRNHHSLHLLSPLWIHRDPADCVPPQSIFFPIHVQIVRNAVAITCQPTFQEKHCQHR